MTALAAIPKETQRISKLMKTQKKRTYAALALLVVGAFTLFQAAQADPEPLQPRNRQRPHDVNVVNPTSSPVPIRDVDNAARQAFQSHVQCSLNGSNACEGTITAPSGKKLVIEFVSISLFADSGAMAYPPRLSIQAGGNQEVYFFSLPKQIDDGSEVVFATTQQTRLYADASGEIQLHCALSEAVSLGSCTATISGYLVDLP